MDKREKLSAMEKMGRELDDVVNTQTSLLKKIAQIEAENINIGNSLLEKQLPEIMSNTDDTLKLATELANEFKQATEKFIVDNKLSEVIAETQ